MRQMIARLARRLFPPSETLEGYEHPELIEVVFKKTLAYQPQDTRLELDGSRRDLWN